MSGVSPGEVNVQDYSDGAEDQSDSTNGLGRSGLMLRYLSTTIPMSD